MIERLKVIAIYLTLAVLFVAFAAFVIGGAQAHGAEDPSITLGRALFHDTAMSAPRRNKNAEGTMSCATCHQLDRFGTDGRPATVGMIENGSGLPGTFNTPHLCGIVPGDKQFWNGRSSSAVDQATQPCLNPIEMGLPNLQTGFNRLAAKGYEPLFRAAFGPPQPGQPEITKARVSAALVSFEQTLRFDSPADLAAKGRPISVSPLATEGFQIFMASNCIDCHRPDHEWRDGGFHNNGYAARLRNNPNDRASVVGRGQNNRNVRAYMPPSLRGAPRTGPWMHDGGLTTLRQVVDHYNAGAKFKSPQNGQIVRDPLADPRIKPLGLSDHQCDALVAWLVEGFDGPVGTGGFSR
jgi:cytochrome c peroxidase